MKESEARQPDRLITARSGELSARDALFREHWRGVWSQAYAMTGSRVQAEDITQDAFERAFRSLDQIDAIESFGAWVRRIAANRTIDLLRRADKQAPEPPDDIAVEWVEPGDPNGIRVVVARLPIEDQNRTSADRQIREWLVGLMSLTRWRIPCSRS